LRLEELLGSLRRALNRLERVDDVSDGEKRDLDLGRGSLEKLLQALGLNGEDSQLLPVVSRLGRRT